MRVLIAIEPRSYRDATGRGIRILRPHHEIIVSEPHSLGEEVARLDPELVLYSEPVGVDLSRTLGWVEYRPYEKPAARVRVGERYWELEDVTLDDLLSIVDETEDAARSHG